jgi:fucose permease
VGVIIVAGYGGGAVIPYAFGKTFHRGVDQAARSALENLFDNLAKEQPFQ